MAEGLGKWLRAAGYDTAVSTPEAKDEELLKITLQENRILLTCDHHFLQMQMPKENLLFLKGNSIEEWVHEINLVLKLDWLYRPFYRCLICNTIFTKADPKTIETQAPPVVLARSPHFWYCPCCKKLFWEGSHTDRMLVQLQSWQTEKF